jgi:phosphoribosyl 1,2-cyclic phosphate phosphodiesterase
MELNQIIVLGTGTSTGVPTLGCTCQVCNSPDPKNKRMRSSILIKTSQDKHIIIDTTPDMRTQLLNNNISYVDAAIITHEHADHTHGIDDLRPFCFFHKSEIPVYTNEECAELMRHKFPYIFKVDQFFKNKKILGGGIPRLKLFELARKEEIEGLEFEFFQLPHGHTTTTGFTTGKFAYIIDCAHIPDDVIQLLKEKELDLLIIDCLRTKPHETHLNLEKSLKYIDAIAPKEAGLIHMSHEFDHQTFSEQLTSMSTHKVFPLYDGQQLSFANQ